MSWISGFRLFLYGFHAGFHWISWISFDLSSFHAAPLRLAKWRRPTFAHRPCSAVRNHVATRRGDQQKTAPGGSVSRSWRASPRLMSVSAVARRRPGGLSRLTTASFNTSGVGRAICFALVPFLQHGNKLTSDYVRAPPPTSQKSGGAGV